MKQRGLFFFIKIKYLSLFLFSREALSKRGLIERLLRILCVPQSIDRILFVPVEPA